MKLSVDGEGYGSESLTPPPLPLDEQQELYQKSSPHHVQVPYIPNYLIHAILVTVFCCVPCGIPAIVFASQVNTKLYSGDIEGAIHLSQRARKWCWIALWVGVVYIALMMFFQFFTTMESLYQSR